MKEELKDENGEGQLAFGPDELFRYVLTTTHLIAEMAAVSILHVEEFPPLYHRERLPDFRVGEYLQAKAFRGVLNLDMDNASTLGGEGGAFEVHIHTDSCFS